MSAYVDMRITANSDNELIEFIRVLKYIEKFGVLGTCRTIHLTVDGDGSGRMRFEILENGKYTDIVYGDNIPVFDIGYNSEYNLSIGE